MDTDTILIVDDESLTRRALLSGVHWDELGISRVLEAGSSAAGFSTVGSSAVGSSAAVFEKKDISVSEDIRLFHVVQSSSAAMNFLVISSGRVIAEPTTTAQEPISIACLSISGVEMFPSAMTGLPE